MILKNCDNTNVLYLIYDNDHLLDCINVKDNITFFYLYEDFHNKEWKSINICYKRFNNESVFYVDYVKQDYGFEIKLNGDNILKYFVINTNNIKNVLEEKLR